MAKPNKGHENLIPYKKGDNKGKSEAGKVGGVKSGESKRERKQFKEIIDNLLERPYKKDGKEVIDETTNEPITYKQAMATKAIDLCLKGSLQGFQIVRDTIGEKPTDEVKHTGIMPIVNIDSKDIKEGLKTIKETLDKL